MKFESVNNYKKQCVINNSKIKLYKLFIANLLFLFYKNPFISNKHNEIICNIKYRFIRLFKFNHIFYILFYIFKFNKLKRKFILKKVSSKKPSLFYKINTEELLITNTNTITSYYFLNFINLKTISFDKNIKYIHKGAFKNCISLEEIILPKNIIKIDTSAFENCINLKYIKFQ